jgi:serine/threonine protein kinase
MTMSDFRIGRFQVLGELGTGAHSTILQVRRNADGKNYALKVVPIHGTEDRKFLEQAQHEFRVAQMLSHPNLMRVYALELVRDWLFRVTKVHLLSEYIKGMTLDTCPALPLPKLVQVFAKVAEGVAHMHVRRVYHADLKPNNIMVSRGGGVKVIDFGLAWIQGEDKDRVQGTPEYMAPEQGKSRIANEQTDVYNLGATMYRMVTFTLPPSCAPKQNNALPITSKTYERMLKPVTELMPGVPQGLADLIHHCLEYRPANRPKSMSEVQEALARLAEEMVRSPEDQLETLDW